MDGFNPEMLQMMRQAYELSRMFGGNAEDTGTDMEDKMKLVIDMMGMFQQPNGAGHDQPMAAFDWHMAPRGAAGRFMQEEIHSPALNSIKAAIPHLDQRYRRYISIFIKLIEIQRMLELYGKAAASMYAGREGEWKLVMLESLKPCVNSAQADMIDFLMTVISLKELTGKIRIKG